MSYNFSAGCPKSGVRNLVPVVWNSVFFHSVLRELSFGNFEIGPFLRPRFSAKYHFIDHIRVVIHTQSCQTTSSPSNTFRTRYSSQPGKRWRIKFTENVPIKINLLIFLRSGITWWQVENAPQLGGVRNKLKLNFRPHNFTTSQGSRDRTTYSVQTVSPGFSSTSIYM